MTAHHQIFYGCLEAFAEELTGKKTREAMITAAKETAKLCKEYNLEVIDFQPILNYEGILDKQEHAERVEEISFRMDVSLHIGEIT